MNVGKPLMECLKLAASCAAATVSVKGTEPGSLSSVKHYLTKVYVERI